MPLRVPCHGRARPGPCATVSVASSVSTPYAPGHCREDTWGAVTRRPQLQSGDGACKGCPLSRLIFCSCNSCAVSYLVSQCDDVCGRCSANGFSSPFVIPSLTNLQKFSCASKKILIIGKRHFISKCCSQNLNLVTPPLTTLYYIKSLVIHCISQRIHIYT